jgi:UDP-4-amino-4,6-dideoxy-N-acetyl-beta-L-altrosamine N-acetyltransferase
VIMHGKVVVLRPLKASDAAITLCWRMGQRARLMQRGAKTIEAQTAWIIRSEQAGDLNYIMEYRGEPVGMIALQELSELHKSIQMGRLLIGEPEIVGSAPVAFEADLLLCDYVFDTLQLHKIYGDVLEDNLAMLRTRLYLGYKQDGLLREHYNYDGVYKNTVAVSLLEDEYRQTCRPKLVQLIDLFLTTCQLKE